MKSSTRNSFIAATFIMAVSAMGPGFLTQTAVFTDQLLASFGFVILATIVLDIIAQLNIWNIIVSAEKRAQDIANEVMPGLGYVLTVLIVFGGFAFNIGNIAGASLGMEVLFGIDPKWGALISCLFALGIFLVHQAALAMDWLMKILGFVKIGLTVYVMWKAQPPVMAAVRETFLPKTIDLNAILTLVGGTVGGYITFAGAHRLLDANIKGPQHVKGASKSAISAIGLASIMRIVLFLAALGVVVHHGHLDPANPIADVFRVASGELGYKLFGIVLWSAGITSIVGAAYTSMSFVKTFHPKLEHNNRYLTVIFILISTAVFIWVGKPVQVLVLAGALNGLILPLALGIMLIAAHQPRIMGTQYKHPWWLTGLGIVVVLLMGYVSIQSIRLGLF